MAAPIVWASAKFGKLLSTIGFQAANGFQQLFVDVDPRTTATDGNKGDTLFSKHGIFQKTDTGSTTNWTRYADQQTYKVYDTFEINNGDGFVDPKWIAYGNTNTALSYPDNFGGAAGPTSGTILTSTDLSGNFALRLNVSSSMSGKGTYRAFTINNGEKGLPFIFESQIKITKLGSAEWASNAQIWVVGSNDNFVSNFQNIPLTNYVVSKSGLLKGSFIDSSSTLTIFRLCIHFSGLTDTFNVDFDEVKIYQSNADTLSPNSKKVISSWGYKAGTTLGAGSTNTKIVYIQSPNIVEQNGSIYDYFTYTQSTVNGDSWVAKSSFKLRVDFCVDEASGNDSIGVSINSTELTTDYATINDNNKLTAISLSDVSLATGVRLVNKGDILRIHRQSLSLNSSGYFKLIFDIDENTGSNVIASGENFMPISVARTSNQSIPNTTVTIVVFDSNPKNDSRYDGAGKFYPNINYGWLKFKGQLNFAFGGGIRSVFLYKNGSSLREQNFDPNDSTTNSTPFDFEIEHTQSTASDYYEIRCYQSNGASINLLSTQTFVDVSRTDKPFSMNLFQAAGMVLSPTDNVLPAKFKRSTAQSVGNGAATPLVFDSTDFNPTGLITLTNGDSKIYNRGNSGYFKVSLVAIMDNVGTGGTGKSFYVNIRKNGSIFGDILARTGGASSSYVDQSGSGSVYLAKDEYIELIANQNSGSTVNYYPDSVLVERIDKTAVSAGGGYTKWQSKTSTATSGTIVSFNNLEIGKTYRLNFTSFFNFDSNLNSKRISLTFLNGTSLVRPDSDQLIYVTGTTRYDMSTSPIFVATATTLNVNVLASSELISTNAHATLEELPQHIQTNQWT